MSGTPYSVVRDALLAGSRKPSTPAWADTTESALAEREHVAEVGTVVLTSPDGDHLAVSVRARVYSGFDQRIDAPAHVHVVRPTADRPQPGSEPGPMTPQAATELASLLIRAAGMAASITEESR
jgi:hypothetical protein